MSSTLSNAILNSANSSEIQKILFIGDIHGQYKKLQALISEQLSDWEFEGEEQEIEPFYLFIGDVIDNKESTEINQLRTLNIVRNIIDSGRGECLLGNHEFNAVGWAMRHPDTQTPLRLHTPGNRKQHNGFLNEVGEDSAEHQRWIAWFKARPLFVEYDDIRAIHACWDDNAINRLKPYLNPDNSLKESHWLDAFNPQHELYELIETVLKGPERELPDGDTFFDKNGKERHRVRIKWWLEQTTTKPTVIGHYTLSGEPATLTDNVVCVDYDAAKEDNPLVAYHWVCDLDSPFSDRGFQYIGKQSRGEFVFEGLEQLFTTYSATQSETGQVTAPEWLLVDKFLWLKWDPIGTNSSDAQLDEYSSYVNQTALLARTGNVQILTAWLWFLETEYMSQNCEKFTPRREVLAQLAIELVQLLTSDNHEELRAFEQAYEQQIIIVSE